MSFDMNALLKQAQEMQEQMQQLQEEAAKETAEASAGGGMVTVVASASGELKELRIDPKAIDPDDPEMLADTLYEVTGRRLALAFAIGEDGEEADHEPEGPAGEERILELMKETLDARERTEPQ